MKITVILCTYNRAQGVVATLEDLAASTFTKPVEWEVLVVDNNSTDQTFEVVDEFCRRSPGRFRYLFEPRQGKSYALNTGVREAHGKVLAFVDDDVRVEPTWLENLTAAFDEGDWAGAGGRTLMGGSFSPPEWMTIGGPDCQGDVLAATFDLGPTPCELSRPPYGTNMAFRREVFVKYGFFRTDLGPQPGSEIRSEDTEFGRRLMAAGERLCYRPSAIVYHPVHENRVRKSFFLRWHFDFGRAMVREWACGPDLFGISRRCFTFFKFVGVHLPRRTLQWLVTRNTRRRFYRKCWVWSTAGQTTELYRQWQSGKGKRGSSAQFPDTAALPKLEDGVISKSAQLGSEMPDEQSCR